MQKILLLCVLLVSFSSPAAFQGKEVIYARLLLSDNVQEVKLGAKVLHHDLLANPLLWDLAAYKLWSGINQPNGKGEEGEDTVAWLIKAIGQSQQAKYRTTLKNLRATVQNPKLTRYLDEAIKKIAETAVPQFEPAHFDISIAFAGVAAVVNEVVPEQSNFDHIQPETELDSVLATLGQPDGVGQYIRNFNRSFIGRQTFQNLRISYFNLGSMEFRYDKNRWLLRVKFSQANADIAAVAQQHQDLLSRLLSGDRVQINAAAQEAIAMRLSDTEVLDQVSQYIWQERATTDRHISDAIAWLCKVLAASGNGRYQQFLQTLGDNGANKKIAKYALISARQLTSAEPHFIPDTGNYQ